MNLLHHTKAKPSEKPVRVAPEAYYLFDTPAPGVPELCDAFKVRHLHESQSLGGGGAGGKTPYNGRTPARTPGPLGSATPGRMSVRQVGRTPNPYGPPTGGPMGGTTPAYPPPASSWGMPPPTTPYGYQTPAPFGQQPPPPPPNSVPPGMNPQRAALIQNSTGAWNQPGPGW